jgi:hypothetical protein
MTMNGSEAKIPVEAATGSYGITRGAAQWLSLAAAPSFGIMALLTGISGSGAMDMVCSPAHGSALSGMVPMYLLMSAFHSAPWLKLIARRRSGARGH